MEQIKIASKTVRDRNKDGVAYLDSKQRPYSIVAVQTQDGRKMSGFAYQGDPILSWQAGETHEVEVNPSKDGKYLNFKVPRVGGQGSSGELAKVWSAVKELEKRVADLELGMPVKKTFTQSLEESAKGEEIRPEDLPFN